MEERERFSIDLDALDHELGLRDAMRLLASTDTENIKPLRREVAMMAAELLEGVDLDALDDETVNALLDRIAQLVFGLVRVGHAALTTLETYDVDRLEYLKAIEEG